MRQIRLGFNSEKSGGFLSDSLRAMADRSDADGMLARLFEEIR
jgi:hypothetical protein